ncbi:hypothetical protein LCL87_23705 [Rhodococcus hoagii]|nr:hypothetical protein [Prescottella equi]
MRKITLAAAGVVAAAGLLVPATANAAEANTPVQFIVTAISGGGLSMTAGVADSLNLSSSNANSVSGSLTAVGVTDSRGGTRGWTASVSITDFVDQASGVTIGKDRVSYKVPSVVPFQLAPATVQILGGGTQTLETKKDVVQRGNITILSDTTSWIPQLTVQLFGDGNTPGTYKATVTTSVI